KSIPISWRMKQGQRRSPWLLILRLHSCVISYAPVFDTTSPGGRATDLDRSWLHCVMGVSPPRGSLPAALLACGWDWAEVSLSLAESLRNSPPQAVLWTDGSAWHLIWPSLMQGLSAQVVLAHPPASLAPVKGPRQEGIQMIGYLIFKEHERKPPHSITR